MTDLAVHRVRLPMRRPLRGVTHRDVTLFHGPAGWGEASPFPGYPVSPVVCEAAAIEAATVAPPAPRRTAIPVNGLIPAIAPGDAAEIAAGLAAAGYETIKVKVGDTGDVDRVAAVRDAVGPGTAIRIDANAAWEADEAVTRIRLMHRHDLELVEEPAAGLEALAAVRRAVDVPVAADESVRSIEDAAALRRMEAADVLVLKVQACGGIREAMRWADAAAMPVYVTSMIESSVGLAAGAALAAALPELPYACGLATAGLLAGDVTSSPLAPSQGWVEVRDVEPDEELLRRYEVAA